MKKTFLTLFGLFLITGLFACSDSNDSSNPTQIAEDIPESNADAIKDTDSSSSAESPDSATTTSCSSTHSSSSAKSNSSAKSSSSVKSNSSAKSSSSEMTSKDSLKTGLLTQEDFKFLNDYVLWNSKSNAILKLEIPLDRFHNILSTNGFSTSQLSSQDIDNLNNNVGEQLNIKYTFKEKDYVSIKYTTDSSSVNFVILRGDSVYVQQEDIFSCRNEQNPQAPLLSKAKYICDERDFQYYKIVSIRNQVWMAQNLNYRYVEKTAELDSSSYCMEELPCDKYGRLYMWSAAVDSAGIFNDEGKGCGEGADSISCKALAESSERHLQLPDGFVHGICPQGWHLPSRDEMEELVETITHEANGNGRTGTDFKSNYGWDTFGGENGTNASGFAALPSTPDGYMHLIGSDLKGGIGNDGAMFWSSYTGFTNKIDLGSLLFIYKKNSTPVESVYKAHVSYLANIRCIKD